MIKQMRWFVRPCGITLFLIVILLPPCWSGKNDSRESIQRLAFSSDTVADGQSIIKDGSVKTLEMEENCHILIVTPTNVGQEYNSSLPGCDGNLTRINSRKQDQMDSEVRDDFNWTAAEDSDKMFISDIRFITLGILQPALAIPGFMFNVINIYVLSKQHKPSANTRILVGLSIADLAFLFVVLMQWAEYLLETFHYSLYMFIVTRIRVYWLGSLAELATGRTSNVLIVVLSIERFIAVRFPFAAKTSLITRHPVRTVVAVFVFVIGLLLPNMFRQENVMVFDPVDNKSFVLNSLTHFAKTNPEFYTIYTYIILITLRFLPVFLVIVLNIAIIVTLKTSRMSGGINQTSEDKRQLREVKVTRMLIAISLIFLICVFPGLIHSLLANFVPEYTRWGDNKEQWRVVFYTYPVLDTFNSAVNFFVYVFTSDNFRNTFIELLCCRSSPPTSQTVEVALSGSLSQSAQ